MRFLTDARSIAAAFALTLSIGAPAVAGIPVHRVPAGTQTHASRPIFKTASSPIQHVIFVIQENRSFNFMFMGYKGAYTRNFGYDQNHNKIMLHSQTIDTSWDIDHSINAYYADCDGSGSLPGTECKMDGWNSAYACCHQPANFGYAYAPRSEVKPYWQMAEQYVLADHMFQSNLDGSFVSHQYAIAAYASTSVNFPGGDWGCPGGSHDTVQTLTQQRTYGPNIVTCFNDPTIGSEADTAGLSWRFYTGSPTGNGGIWSAYQAIQPIYNSGDWGNDVIPSQSQFISDIGSGKLANITWITPTWSNSDHGGMDSTGGPPWVSSIVDAVGQSQFWNSSAIFIMWDDWGGFFDPINPVTEDYDGLGFRVPLIVISPYAKKHVVIHKQYETASVLKFMEDNWTLNPLAAADARANDPAAEAFNYSQSPRPFKNIQGAKPYRYWRQLEVEQANQPRRALVDGD